MGEPTPQELREADLSREARAKGYMLTKHNDYDFYSLQRDGLTEYGPAEGLDGVAAFLQHKPRQSGR